MRFTVPSYAIKISTQNRKMYQQLYSLLLLCVLFNFSYGLDATFTLMEEKDSGTLVGNILNRSGLSSNLQNQNIQSLRYNFLENESPMKTLFSINDRTSDLFTTVVVDREHVCEFKPVCQLEFDVSVQSTEHDFFERITVIINIDDENDNNPIFPEPKVVLRISESAEIGSAHGIDSAMDPDSGVNSIQKYEIQPKNGAFSLATSRNIDDTFTIKIVVNTSLNRETQDHYQVTVIATDGGNPKKEGIVVVDIEVTDSNDNPPIFAKKTYQVNVKEDFTLNVPILKVSATDEDIGVNADLFYKFSSRQTDQGIFTINDTTGAIMLVQPLVYRPRLSYRLVVEVSDRSADPLVDQAEVIINVQDSGNNPPKVKVNILNPGNVRVVDISESAPTGKHIAHVDVEDSDTGDNGVVDCETTTSLFSLQNLGDGKGFMVIVNETLDREKEDTHNVTTVCRDHGNPPLSSSASFFVHVTDTNDETPMFVTQHYFTDIIENSTPGKSLLIVSAYDKDLDLNARIRYQLHEDAKSKFLIDSDTGEITTNGVFDREVTPTIVFRVLAIDSGLPPLIGTATINVNVGDINDNAPVFDKSNLELEIEENKNANSVVGKVSAQDSDAGINATVEFSLLPGQELDFPFDVLSDGTVKTNRELDREKQSRYDFMIVAKDNGASPLSSSTWVTVAVQDLNDNEPIIRWPNATNNILQILDIIPNQPIAQVRAYDIDDNQELSYTIQGGNQENAFSLDKQSGELYITEGYHTSQDQEFVLTVAVKDDGEHPLYSNHHLRVIIKGSNETVTGEILEVSQKYIIISAVVVTVTILISIGLIAVICVVRRVDKQKQKEYSSNRADKGTMQTYDKHSSHGLSNGVSNKNVKKGVSFSLDNEDMQIPLSKISMDMKSSKNKKMGNQALLKSIPFSSITDSQNNQMKTLQMHQELITNKNLTQYDDNHSETSEEITASDSGRGGSEDETAHNTTLQDEVYSVEQGFPAGRAHFGPRDTQPLFVRLHGNRTSSFMNRNGEYGKNFNTEGNCDFPSDFPGRHERRNSDTYVPSYV